MPLELVWVMPSELQILLTLHFSGMVLSIPEGITLFLNREQIITWIFVLFVKGYKNEMNTKTGIIAIYSQISELGKEGLKQCLSIVGEKMENVGGVCNILEYV